MAGEEVSPVRIALFRYQFGGVVGRLINAFSFRGGFSHAELVFSNGACFSSAGESRGTRFKWIDLDPNRWVLIDVPATDDEEAAVHAWCIGQLGKGYDWRGVLGMILPCRADEKTRLFCSETVVAALQQIGRFGQAPAWRVSPNGIWLIHQAGGI
jgi:hypothetical protein